jgi:hypothetical protein
MSMPRPIRVAIAAYDGVSLLDLSGPLEAFRVSQIDFYDQESQVTRAVGLMVPHFHATLGADVSLHV